LTLGARRRIYVVFGGRSAEHEVSVASAASVLEHLDRETCDVVPVAITKEGAWLWGLGPEDLAGAEAGSPRAAPPPADGTQEVFLPILLGPNGEDGTIQGLFEMWNVPYSGSGVLASAIGMDKEIMKRLFAAAGLPVVDWLAVKRPAWERSPDGALDAIERRLPVPWFVKPANLGSSIGVSRAVDRDGLRDAVRAAFEYDRKIIVEQGLDVRELSCAVLGNAWPEASVVGEVRPGAEFHDYEDKYLDNTTSYDIPASGFPPEQAAELGEMALCAYEALDLSGMARVDFFLDRSTGRCFVNEVNTMPGFTRPSLYPRLWAATGLPYPQLLDRLIELALDRHAERQRRRLDRDGRRGRR
jgi:D-alanine-D-alanine ligase